MEGNVNVHMTLVFRNSKNLEYVNLKGNRKNSDKCKWSHQIPKPLYKEKTAASDASSSYTKYSQKHRTQNSMSIKICLKVQMKATKIYKLKTTFYNK